MICGPTRIKTIAGLGIACLLHVSLACADETPLLYATFDDSLYATESAGSAEGKAIRQVTYDKGVKGKAVIAGKNGYVLFPAQHNFNAQEGTLSIWVKPVDWNGADEFMHPFFFAASDNQDTQCRLILYKFLKSDKITLLSDAPDRNESKFIQLSTVSWDEKSWVHLAVTWTPERMELFVNGELVGESPRKAPEADDFSNIALGTMAAPETEGGHTAFDELKIFGSALSADQIRSLYEQDRAGATAQ